MRFLPGLPVLTLALISPAVAQPPVQADSLLQQLVRDYTGLYTRDSFEVWTRLFRPGFTALSTNADGTLTFRNLADFLEAQRRGFIRAREMREELEHVRIEQKARLASIWADFVFHYDGRSSRGKLVLLAAADSGGWRFTSLMFSYDEP